MPLSNPSRWPPGATDYLAFTISLPTTADNSFQGKSAVAEPGLHRHPAHRHRPLIAA